jgi:hypothetical protein
MTLAGLNPLSENKSMLWRMFSARCWRTVLECGPLDGRDTIHLAKFVDTLIAIEGRAENLLATQLACEAAGVQNVTLLLGNLETLDLGILAPVDAAWCSGVLYHFAEPWLLVDRLRRVAPIVYGWSHVAECHRSERGGYGGYEWAEVPASRFAGLSPASFWLLPGEFARMFRERGFRFDWVVDPAPHINGGLAGQFVAEVQT